MSEARVLIVIPTLGGRPALLDQCIQSITSQSIKADVVLVAPAGNDVVSDIAVRHNLQVVADPGGLAAAINLGIALAETKHEYVNWLGDDDLLEPGSLAATVAALDADRTAVLAYGACRYIDEVGRELWISRAGKWAPRILKWGPDLIPQPGMLVRFSAWEFVGGLDDSLRFAFDLDLLLKLQQCGKFIGVDVVVSSFRWHGDSLTVGDRSTSMRESETARRRALSPTARKCAWIWEGPVRAATRLAVLEMGRRVRHRERVLDKAELRTT